MTVRINGRDPADESTPPPQAGDRLEFFRGDTLLGTAVLAEVNRTAWHF